jgi:hypothetical protein
MMAAISEPRSDPSGGPLSQLSESPVRRRAGVHSVRVSTICEINLTCDDSDGEYVAVSLSVAAPEGQQDTFRCRCWMASSR